MMLLSASRRDIVSPDYWKPETLPETSEGDSHHVRGSSTFYPNMGISTMSSGQAGLDCTISHIPYMENVLYEIFNEAHTI
jgi:hypothetical protein